MTEPREPDPLSQELRRRAASAKLGPGWSRDDLLPRVRSSIDSRPTPVLTSRWSALAGLAGIVAVLILLVVALPRLIPAPAQSTPGSPVAVASPTDGPRASNVPTPGTTAPRSLEPDARPSVPPIDPEHIECQYPSADGRSTEISIVDHSGLVIGCNAFVELSMPEAFAQASSVGPDETLLEVRWEIPQVCTSMPVQLGLWGPLTYDPPFGLPPPFVLQVDEQTQPGSGQGCRASVATQGVRLALRSAISAEDVEPFRTSGGRGFDVSRLGDHSLALTLTADTLEYEAGQPIDIAASLLYLGPKPNVRLDAGDPNPAFGFHQLDGPVRQMVASDLMSEAVELERDVPLVIPYRKNGAYITDRADGPFSEEAYRSDPQLRLPPGLYRVYVSGGGDLDGNFWDRDSRIVYARASIVIRVR